MKLYNTRRGVLLERADGRWVECGETIDALVARGAGMIPRLRAVAERQDEAPPPPAADLLAPIGSQEVWGAGVTYLRSRAARMEESHAAGGAGFYDRVYHAERPELFLKATAHRVVGPGQPMRLRRDSRWIVPEPELTLLVGPDASILGYTVGNDLSCRDLEGDNPLYLPQAKTYDRCAALGPGVLIAEAPLDPATPIRLEVRRNGDVVFAGETAVGRMKRSFEELVAFLYREASFPSGCFLMTGTGVVPPDAWSLRPGDVASIAIDPIGTLSNRME